MYRKKVLEGANHGITGILVVPMFYLKMEVMEVSYKKLNTQWPIWEIIATAAAGWGENEEKYEEIFLSQNRKYLLH